MARKTKPHCVECAIRQAIDGYEGCNLDAIQIGLINTLASTIITRAGQNDELVRAQMIYLAQMLGAACADEVVRLFRPTGTVH